MAMLRKYNKLRNRNSLSKKEPKFDSKGTQLNPGAKGAPHIPTPNPPEPPVPADYVPEPKTPKVSPPKVQLTPRESAVLNAARGAATRLPGKAPVPHYEGVLEGLTPTREQYNDMVSKGVLETPKLDRPLGQNY